MMISVFVRAFLAAGFAAAALAQSAGSPASFAAADVHVSVKAPNPYMTSSFRGGRYQIRRATMLDLIRIAYGLDSYRILGGPGWMENDRFDVIANAPANTPPEGLRETLKILLADRFRLAVHNDTKEIRTFFLTARAKKNMTSGEGSGPPGGCDYSETPRWEPGKVRVEIVNCRNATMDQLINALHYQYQGPTDYLGEAPVLDKTGIEGGWNFKIQWTRRADLQMTGSDGVTIFDAVDKQLGLKLEARNAQTAVVVVDRVNEKPSDNPPDVARLPPPPPIMPKEFEVADIKPTRPGAPQNFRVTPGGYVELRGATLQNLITIAWNIDSEMLVGAAKWLNTDRFDVVARASTGDDAKNAQVDFETIQTMMRALLTDRFGLAVHEDVQPVNIYALTAPKRDNKLKKADETDRASCKNSPDLLPPKTALTVIYACQNTTMAEFADKVRDWAPVYLDHPVLDLTGIGGRFDFTLGWTGKQKLMPNPVNPAAPGGASSASDPTGGVSIFEAVERQLGLKLEAQKHPMPVVMIDRISQKPTDN
jgi:uncharacterized protein (TIGR03435 family)